MFRLSAILLLLVTTWTMPRITRAEETLAEKVARQHAEVKRKMAQQKKKMAAKNNRQTKSTTRRNSKVYRDYLRSVAESEKKEAARRKAAQARRDSFKSNMAPDEWLARYVKTALSAKSFDQLLPYVTNDRAKSYLHAKANYNPKEAKKRRRELQRDSGFSPDLIDRMTSHPSKHALRHHKEIANKITSIKPISVHINKDRASMEVDIRSDAVINGKAYTRSTATIGLVGEGKTWRFKSFEQSVFVWR